MIVRRPVPEDRAVLASVRVPDDAPPRRLDRVATETFDAFPTRGSARKAARRGELAVDGVISESGRWVPPGSEVSWLEPEDDRVPVLTIDVPVLFEDAHLAVVAKPSGLCTSGARPRTLERALPHNVSAAEGPDALRRPRPVHRLDAPTAGLVVVAKTRTALAELGWAFQQRRVHKRYRAVLVGLLTGEGQVEAPIDDRTALTRYRVLDHGPTLHAEGLTRVDLWPHTGRTHQLRRHMAGLGHPILGDVAYGMPETTLRGKGLFLFALEIRLPHPITGAPLVVSWPEPAKVASLMAREARRFARATSEA